MSTEKEYRHNHKGKRPGIGGWDCPCCGPAPGKNRTRLKKSRKRRFNQEMEKAIRKSLEDKE